MRKYHFTANNPELAQPNQFRFTVNIEGWVLAKNIDKAEAIIKAKGWRRVSLTPYSRDKQFNPAWATKDAQWVESLSA